VIALGVDIASKTGWSIVESQGGREALLEYGIVDIANPTPLWEQIDAVLDKGRHVAVVALELPYLAKENPHVLEVLARLCGQWEHACAIRGLEAVLVRSKTWQTAILRGLITTSSKREQCKRAAQTWCRATFGLDLPEDEADATAIATWALRTARARKLGIG
jgi:Holliday junction resolvasome RuvABC endonuclease subunit